MTYAEFEKTQEAKKQKRLLEMERIGNIAYNKGLLKGLGFRVWLYPLLKRAT